MCRLLGITNFNFKEHKPLVEKFLALAQSGKVLPGDAPGHLDGWGLGYYKNKKAKVIKSGNSALSERNKILARLKKIETTSVLILHLRKSAWKGTTSARHSHPFVFDNMIFAHNGTIRNYKKLSAAIPKRFKPAPDSLDSEVFFRFLAFKGIKNLKTSFAYISKNYDYTALNCLITDGASLNAYRDYTKEPDYYALFKSKCKASSIILSEPLTTTKGAVIPALC